MAGGSRYCRARTVGRVVRCDGARWDRILTQRPRCTSGAHKSQSRRERAGSSLRKPTRDYTRCSQQAHGSTANNRTSELLASVGAAQQHAGGILLSQAINFLFIKCSTAVAKRVRRQQPLPVRHTSILLHCEQNLLQETFQQPMSSYGRCKLVTIQHHPSRTDVRVRSWVRPTPETILTPPHFSDWAHFQPRSYMAPLVPGTRLRAGNGRLLTGNQVWMAKKIASLLTRSCRHYPDSHSYGVRPGAVHPGGPWGPGPH
jgi:hypothetical protein